VVFTEYINLNVVLSRLGRNFAEEGIEVLGTREIIPTFSRGLSYDELRMESYQNIPMQDNMGTCCILGRK